MADGRRDLWERRRIPSTTTGRVAGRADGHWDGRRRTKPNDTPNIRVDWRLQATAFQRDMNTDTANPPGPPLWNDNPYNAARHAHWDQSIERAFDATSLARLHWTARPQWRVYVRAHSGGRLGYPK